MSELVLCVCEACLCVIYCGMGAVCYFMYYYCGMRCVFIIPYLQIREVNPYFSRVTQLGIIGELDAF